MDASLNLEGDIHFVLAWILLLLSAVIVIVDIISNGLGERFERRIIFLKPIEHFIFQSAEESFNNAVVIAVALSGHRLNDSMFLKFIAVKRVLVLPSLI